MICDLCVGGLGPPWILFVKNNFPGIFHLFFRSLFSGSQTWAFLHHVTRRSSSSCLEDATRPTASVRSFRVVRINLKHSDQPVVTVDMTASVTPARSKPVSIATVSEIAKKSAARRKNVPGALVAASGLGGGAERRVVSLAAISVSNLNVEAKGAVPGIKKANRLGSNAMGVRVNAISVPSATTVGVWRATGKSNVTCVKVEARWLSTVDSARMAKCGACDEDDGRNGCNRFCKTQSAIA